MIGKAKILEIECNNDNCEILEFEETSFVMKDGRFYVKTFGKWQTFEFKGKHIELKFSLIHQAHGNHYRQVRLAINVRRNFQDQSSSWSLTFQPSNQGQMASFLINFVVSISPNAAISLKFPWAYLQNIVLIQFKTIRSCSSPIILILAIHFT